MSLAFWGRRIDGKGTGGKRTWGCRVVYEVSSLKRPVRSSEINMVPYVIWLLVNVFICLQLAICVVSTETTVDVGSLVELITSIGARRFSEFSLTWLLKQALIVITFQPLPNFFTFFPVTLRASIYFVLDKFLWALGSIFAHSFFIFIIFFRVCRHADVFVCWRLTKDTWFRWCIVKLVFWQYILVSSLRRTEQRL